jgi:hypothetical protein
MYNPYQCELGEIVAWRNPTKAEIKFGYGAIHYKTFPREIFERKNKTLKRWTVCPIDGLRYNLPR